MNDRSLIRGSLGMFGSLTALFGALLSVFVVASDGRAEPSASTDGIAALSPGAMIEDERNTVSVYEAMAPATVFVTQNQRMLEAFTRKPLEVASGSGTGFIWDTNGHIVTNYHVVAGASSLRVTLQNQESYEATLVGGEPRRDLAVLKIDAPAEQLIPVRRMPKSGRLVVGQKAVAIGNPFGLDHTLTTGVVSALDREVQGYGGVTIPGMIQTDASINPGNSGGPLLDSQGRLMGMNTMIFSQSGGSAGIGFAVPSSIIERLVPQIIRDGKVVQAGIGISVAPEEWAIRLGIEGVIVDEVSPGSPAASAGLSGIQYDMRGYPMDVGDVIVAVDGEDVANYDDLYNLMDLRTPGDRVQLTIQRGGKRRTVAITLIAL